MPKLARGAAFFDSSGALAASDEGFLRALGLPARGGDAALRARLAGAPGLATLLRGGGPDGLAIAGADGEPLLLERHPAGSGLLLVVRAEGDDELLEHAARSQGLGLLASGLTHDVNGTLHTMNLQLALLEEKLGDGAGGRLAAPHLGMLREQVTRVARMIRRCREVAEPEGKEGGLDVGALVSEVVALLAHDLHRREIQLALQAPAAVARTSAPAERAVRLVLGLLQQAAAATPTRGALAIEVAGGDEGPTLSVAHTAGGAPPGLAYYSEVAAEAAAALGGRLARASEDGRERMTLQLPRGSQG
jgi:signal transduction histidine kinase